MSDIPDPHGPRGRGAFVLTGLTGSGDPWAIENSVRRLNFLNLAVGNATPVVIPSRAG